MRKIIFTLLLSYTFIGFSQNTAIPDSNFEQALIDLGIDTNPTIDGQVPTADIEGLTFLDVNSKNITDLTGIEGFISLTDLFCKNNELTSLNVTNNTALTQLICENNQLTSLDLSNNIVLDELQCQFNLFTSLDFSNNIDLGYLICSDNQLTNLDVSQNIALSVLICENNQLSNLDVTNNNALSLLNCGQNLLTNLDVSENNVLTFLDCSDNPFTSIDVSANLALQALYCKNNQLTSIDVTNNPALTELRFAENQLTSLDVSANPALFVLDCSDNLFTSIDVSANIALQTLYCKNNQLTGLLDLSNYTALTGLDCRVNKIEILNIKNGNNINVTQFLASTNPDLYCIVVDDIDYSTTNWTNRDPASTFVNNETDCDALSLVDNNFELEVTIYPNPTDNYLFIEGNENPISITIYNLLGAKVIAKSNTDKIDVSELSKGVYIINISDGVSQTNKKFVKN